MNKKAFTLIELLAVIVILGVLLAIAVPSVSRYISVSKKSTYIDNAQSYASTARDQAMLGTYKFPVNTNEATVIYFDDIAEYLDKGGKNSPYGSAYQKTKSFVVIANTKTAEDPKYEYYIAAIDNDGYGIGTLSGTTATAEVIAYNDLTTGNIIQLTASAGVTVSDNKVTVKGKTTAFTVTNTYGGN